MKNFLIIIGIILALFAMTTYMENAYTTIEIYSADIDTLERIVDFEIKVKTDASIEERLEAITKGLSTNSFILPMEFLGIKQVFGQNIAYINLKENPDNPELYPWNTGYFQGSTGGAITAITLINSYLQPNYDGTWIDGVKFLYEGEMIEFEHVYGLQQTQYRSKKFNFNAIEVNSELMEDIVLKTKFISENKLEIAYDLEGTFPAVAQINYYQYDDTYSLMLLDSPIMSIELDIEFAEGKMPYRESFNWIIDIRNPEYLKVAIKDYDPTLYEAFKDGETVELPVLLSDFSSWLFAESEYINTVKFVEILEERP